MAIRFELLQGYQAALGPRLGRLVTPHGDIETPVFMPVGTQATVKSLSPTEVAGAGAQVILANTYHLYLRPGPEVVREAGGLHHFMGWPHSILTDSGGFQVFSLAPLRRISEDGVLFRSHLDGSEHFFTPERAVAIQEALGADIIMAFDECPPYPCTREEAEAAARRTLAWARRCLQAQRRADQALFGIVQGSVFPELRAEQARALVELDFPGYAIGGLSVGEPKPLMYDMLEVVTPLLPREKPRYLMGVGSPDALLEGVARGIDMFDCVLPTREARHGRVYTWDGVLTIRNATFARDWRPIDAECGCEACRHFTRAYLRHLFKAGEILGLRLATLHNLHFFLDLMAQIRKSLREGRFELFRRQFYQRFYRRDRGEPSQTVPAQSCRPE